MPALWARLEPTTSRIEHLRAGSWQLAAGTASVETRVDASATGLGANGQMPMANCR